MNLYSVKARHASAPDYISANTAAEAVSIYLAALPVGHSLGSVMCRPFIFGETDCTSFNNAGHIPHGARG